MPERIQMTRSRPWRAHHPNAVRVDRSTKWGNPFRYGDRQYGLVRYGPAHLERFGRAWDYEGRCSAPGSHDMWFAPDDVVETYVRLATHGECVELYELAMLHPTPGMVMAYPSGSGRLLQVTADDVVRDLRGKDLACWCPPTEPCHADFLLKLANPTAEGDR